MKTSALTALLICGLIGLAAGAGEDWPGEGGKSDSVKNWPARDFETATTSGMPLCVYFFDPQQKSNARAKTLEGYQALANAELKSVLKPFLCLKIRSDATDVKGWPANLREIASRSASLVLISSDYKNIISFDKTNTQNVDIRPDRIILAAQSILHYEEKKAAFKEEQAKLAAMRSKSSKDEGPTLTKGVPGLRNPDEKEPPKRPVERKRRVPADE
ncbi:MAG TPA: hypothetical protein VEK08_01225 [Planctomycetota bacterium]|nr:hypothetical protein [Planctomycetota bacterium]